MDKILESMFDYGMPLTEISASRLEGLAGSMCSEIITSGELEYRTTYDSITDGSRNEPQKTTVEDSIFEKTGKHTSVSSSNSIFGKNSEGHDPRY